LPRWSAGARLRSGLARADTMGLLHDILAEKAKEVAALRGLPSVSRPSAWPVRDVVGALRRPKGAPLRLIAEIKFRSPSAGPLSRDLGPRERAEAYAAGGAAMVSVLTDKKWFDGSLDDLMRARAGVSVPVLCKDYIIDPIQIDQAVSAGADAVLIIVRCVAEGDALAELVEAAQERGVEPFVEVVTEDELDRALGAGARVIGVNARDLDTLEMDAARAKRVLARIPEGVVAVHLSGLKTAADAASIALSRADAALIGEALMRQGDPRALLAELVRAAAGKN
jgi:indole-3-glycerol phosphate synthase